MGRLNTFMRDRGTVRLERNNSESFTFSIKMILDLGTFFCVEIFGSG